jgi:polysaccharide pyruvyl transferase WcaK-like protein
VKGLVARAYQDMRQLMHQFTLPAILAIRQKHALQNVSVRLHHKRWEEEQGQEQEQEQEKEEEEEILVRPLAQAKTQQLRETVQVRAIYALSYEHQN